MKAGETMPKANRKLLPKDFDALLAAGDIAKLQAVFETCDLDARGGYSKHVALAFRNCPDELAHWLVSQGADIEARDSYGRTPLHDHAADWQGRFEVLLDLGADIHAIDKDGDTPLHKAARSANLEAVRSLRGRGAPTDALNASGLTPLAAGLQHCSNIQIEPMAAIAELLLATPAPRRTWLGDLRKRAFSGRDDDRAPPDTRMRDFVHRIGENFEFHRPGFNPDHIEGASAALDRLYALFGVPPVPSRGVHDGRTPIIARSASWQDQHQELWSLLVPSKGAASTVQGEVIRIAGRVADEIDRNGAVNWDADYGRMTRAFLTHVGSGSPLPDAERDRAARLIATVRNHNGAAAELCELAVQWVKLNPTPVALTPPDYTR